VDLSTFGEIVQAPLGHIVHARAGDKGSNCNVGFFVRYADEWDWLRSFLTTERIIELLEEDYVGQKIDRMEFGNMWAVHFLLVSLFHPSLFISLLVEGFGEAMRGGGRSLANLDSMIISIAE
jgi:hypothetical protein